MYDTKGLFACPVWRLNWRPLMEESGPSRILQAMLCNGLKQACICGIFAYIKLFT